MTGWRQAVFLRQRRIDVIQRALSAVLDAESWTPATPRRLYVGAADASSRGWTMIVPELADFFLDRGGMAEPRLCRLASELRRPAHGGATRDAAGPARRRAALPGLGGRSGRRRRDHAVRGRRARADPHPRRDPAARAGRRG